MHTVIETVTGFSVVFIDGELMQGFFSSPKRSVAMAVCGLLNGGTLPENTDLEKYTDRIELLLTKNETK